MLLSILTLLFCSPNLILDAMISSASNSITLCIKLCAIYCVWLSVLEIVEKTGLANTLAKALKKPIKKLFKLQDEEQIKYVALNLSCNFLGLGNAATPSGIKAVESIYKNNKNSQFPLLMLLIINATSIQLLPTTQMGLLASTGGTNPASIVLPSIIASTISTIVGIFLFLLWQKLKRRKL